MKKKNILIISDDLNTGRSLAFILEAAQYNTELVPNYEHFRKSVGLWKAGERGIDLFIVDLETPGVCENGWRKDFMEIGNQIPTLALNGYPDTDVGPFNHFLQKPFDAQHLLSQVKRLLEVKKKKASRNRAAKKV